MVDLVTSFEALRPPEPGSGAILRFSAMPIPGYERHRIGKDAHGAPSLLVAVAGGRGHVWPAPIVLEHLTVQHDLICRITEPDGSIEEERFTVVRCTDGDRALHVYFLRVAATVVALLGETPTHSDVSGAIDRLVELFRSMTAAPRKSVQGLWAELLLMAMSRDAERLLAAWHVLPGDRYDFSAGSQRIEVKAAAGRTRQHHFSLEQLVPIAGAQVLVASILVERAGAGASLQDLVSEVRSRISDKPELLLQLEKTVTQTLGDSWRHALGERFDRHLAENSLAFFEAAQIPRVPLDLPVGVSEVHFRADLTGLPSADLAVYRSQGGLFRGALPR